MRIGSKIFAVGGIPIVIAAGITLASLVLTREADRARSGAVKAGVVYRYLLAAVTARNDYMAATANGRERFRSNFYADAARAEQDLKTLQDLSRPGERPAIAQSRQTLSLYVDNMDKVVAVTTRNDTMLAAMAYRTDLMISLADQARDRQHASNADIVTSLSDGDRKLRAARDVVDAAYGLRLAVAAVQAGQLELRTATDPVARTDTNRKLSFDLGRLRRSASDLAAILHRAKDSPAEDELKTADEVRNQLATLKPPSDPEKAEADWTSDTQDLLRRAASFADGLVKVHSAEYRSYHDQAAQLLTYSVEAHETEQATQKIAVETLKLVSRTSEALARRDENAWNAVLEESRTLPSTIAALPISPLIQTEMIDAFRSWRDGLLTTTEGLARQNDYVSGMDQAASEMIEAARSLDETFTLNAQSIGRSVQTILMVGAGVGLLFGSGAGLLVARSITKPLHRLQLRMMELAGGPGAESIDDEGRRDELGDMARAANVFLREITRRERVIRQAKDRADQALDRLRETQAELIQAEKLASLGQLVAGVAHEINTPIGIAVTTSTVLEDDMLEFRRATKGGQISRALLDRIGERLADGTRLISTNLARAADLVQSFKHVAVDQTSGEKRRFEVNRWLKDVLTSLGPMLRKSGQRATMDCPPGLVLDTHPGALAQVITNLIVNASLHAYGAGAPGEIAVVVDPPRGTTLRLVVQDHGRGIAPADRVKIFDPFFTTRRAEGSTGLGLHIVYNLVTSTLGGRIECESDPGHGTRFVVELPYGQPNAEAAASPLTEKTG